MEQPIIIATLSIEDRVRRIEEHIKGIVYLLVCISISVIFIGIFVFFVTYK